tara:strand:- start:166 stop:525 length:360 start_codon:yes stop_codon:yes gene_type:complete
MILSCVGSHYLVNNTAEGSDWDQVWAQTRSRQMHEHWDKKKLTIFAISNIMSLPKETTRRKVEILKKKKFISYTTKAGLFPTEKIEEMMKPYAAKELKELSKFLQALKKHKSLDKILNI